MATIWPFGKSATLKDGGFFSWFFGGGTHANKTVNEETALTVAAVYSCIKVIAQTVATLPLQVYERQEDGSRKVAVNHPLYTVLSVSPNADQTGVEYWEGKLVSTLLRGAAVSRKHEANGKIIGLEMLPFDKVKLRRNSGGYLEAEYDSGSKTEIIPEEQLFLLKGFGAGGDLGLSPLQYGRHALASAMAADESAGKIFANGMMPTGVFTFDTELKPDQREQFRENIIKPVVGSGNTGKSILLEYGIKFQQLSLSPGDVQMLETRRFNVEEICRLFCIPPILIGHSAPGMTAWGSGIEQIMIGWLQLGLRSELKRIEAAINKRLLKPEDQRRYYAEFSIEGLLRGDSKARAEFASKMINGAALTPNEWRRLENLPAMPGGEKLYINSTLVPLDKAGLVLLNTQTPEPDERDEP